MSGELINFKKLECAGLACRGVKDRADLERLAGIRELFKLPVILGHRMTLKFHFSCSPIK